MRTVSRGTAKTSVPRILRMRSQTGRPAGQARPAPCPSTVGLSVIVAAILTLALNLADSARAGHAGGMDAMSLDMDHSASPANTASSIGTREECASIMNNGALDGDEDSTDALFIDVTALNIPQAHAMVGFSFVLAYNETALTVRDAVYDAWKLAANTGSLAQNFGDSVPDANNNGIWAPQVGDISGTAGEFGSGVLMRMTIGADPGASPGVYNLTLASASHVDELNESLASDKADGASIAIDQLCPAQLLQTDIAVTAASISAPGTAGVSETFTVTASATLHNAGPFGPSNADASATLSTGSGCSVTTPATIAVADISLPVSANVTLGAATLSWGVACNTPGDAALSLSVNAALDTINAIDPNQANNAAGVTAGVSIIARSDVQVTSVAVVAPATETVGTAFPVSATATLKNNGPSGPTGVAGSFALSAPGGCSVLFPSGPKTVTGASVPLNSPVTASPADEWLVTCDRPGTFTFDVSTVFTVSQAGVTDPNTSNDFGSGQGSTMLKVGACGPDPNPSGDVLRNPSPTLLDLMRDLSDDGTPVSGDQTTPLACSFEIDVYDDVGAHIDDCKVSGPIEVPCTMSLEISIDEPGGSPDAKPTARLVPTSLIFIPPQFDIAGDLEVPNGLIAGSGAFRIRTDGGLTPFGVPCILDAASPTSLAREGGILPNVNDSNLSSDLVNPGVWPNDLNAERAAIEDAFRRLPPPAPSGITLWSRLSADLVPPGLAAIPFNILIWRIDDPTFQAATGARWLAVGFPGDPLNPDPPGPNGGNPDADDAFSLPTVDCAPHAMNFTLAGRAGSSVYVACLASGEHMAWAIVDPDVVHFSGDQGPRSDTSRCSPDLDNDGLTENEETYFGTNNLDPDTDKDTVLDGPDNCRVTANPDQRDFDGDAVGDKCDPDIDGDGVANASDRCPGTRPGDAVDSQGCSNAQVDSDGDGFCNPGAPAPGPGGSCTPNDNCPTHANPGQEDVDRDGKGDACDPDNDGDGTGDADEPACGGENLNPARFPERTSGAFANRDDDGDGQVDEPLPAGAENFDCDGDGYKGSVEDHVFGAGSRRDQDNCGTDAWPADFVSGGEPDSTNRITLTDVMSFIAPSPKRLGTNPGDQGYDVRWDLDPGKSAYSTTINITDILNLVVLRPAMLNGDRAFGGLPCVP